MDLVFLKTETSGQSVKYPFRDKELKVRAADRTERFPAVLIKKGLTKELSGSIVSSAGLKNTHKAAFQAQK